MHICTGTSNARGPLTEMLTGTQKFLYINQCPAGPDLVFEPTLIGGNTVLATSYIGTHMR